MGYVATVQDVLIGATRILVLFCSSSVLFRIKNYKIIMNHIIIHVFFHFEFKHE